MKYEVRLLPNEVILNVINQNLTSRAFLFWRKVNLTLTNKRLHAFQKYIVSHSQRSFDLRDIDSIFQERRFNGLYSLFFGFFLSFIIVVIGLIIRKLFYGTLYMEEDPIRDIFGIIGIFCWIFIFIVFFFKRLLIIRSRNDKMAIDLIWMPKEVINDFVQAVFAQKEFIITGAQKDQTLTKLTTIEALKNLKSMLSEGLINQDEYEIKKKELLSRM